MTAFRLWLLTILAVLVPYTVVVISNHGWGLMEVFFGDIMTMAWPGQFNLDFLFMLTLSGIWVAWRNRFSALGLVLGLLALFGGAPFLSTYLLFLTFQAKGDIKEVLIGRP